MNCMIRNIAYWSSAILTAAFLAYLAVTYGLAVLIAREVLA